jgi:hypothetical protein
MINVPVGIGVVICIMGFIGLIWAFSRIKNWRSEPQIPIVIVWFVLTFLFVNSVTFHLSFSLYSFRIWLLMSIPIAFLATYGTWWLISKCQKEKVSKYVVVGIIIFGVLFTSFSQKYEVNTAIWGAGGDFSSFEEMDGYSWLLTLPAHTPVFALCPSDNDAIPGFKDAKVIGFDKSSCAWCPDVLEYRKTAFNQTSSDLRDWLKSKQYQYFTIDSQCIIKYGVNETNAKVNEYAQQPGFTVAHNTNMFIVFKVE